MSGREVGLQPRVFDLLVYLVRTRDRVVPKEELLSEVWTDVIVSDGSLKRAVSLLRSALREGGCEDAIRTYPRQGYRFDLEELRETAGSSSPALAVEIVEARRAYADERWQAAAERYRQADSGDGLEAADLERWAEAEQCAGRPWQAIAPLERAVAAHSAAGDSRGAARAALELAHIHLERMELSIGRGWLERARNLLGDGAANRESGFLAAISSRYAIVAGDHDAAVELGERAVDIGREIGDADVEVLGSNYLGMVLVASGDLDRGLVAHEQAAASVLSSEVSPRIAGLIYCGLIWTCRNRGDWTRALEWSERFSRWCEESSLEAFAGTCQLHHAEVLHQRGELDAAEREARHACEVMSDLAPYARGDGCRVLGDLHLARGDLDAAEQAYRQAHELGWDPQPGLARVMAARGQAGSALRALERSLAGSNWANRQRRAVLLAGMVTVALSAGELESARRAVTELDELACDGAPAATSAAAAAARAELREHEGDLAGAVSDLHRAVVSWHRIGSPLHVARCRLRLAAVLAADGDRAGAELELSAARACVAALDVTSLSAELERIERSLG